MTEYSTGFMFEGTRVALILKQRPKWQRGRLNGVGGHIEEGETPAQAMAREFEEETGFQTEPGDWKPLVVLSGDDFKVHFFYTWGELSLLETKTDEEIVVVPVSSVTVQNAIPNLTWLLPMAKSLTYDRASHFEIHEVMEAE
jgi:8-oxo-dGTP diphosphatase